MLRYTINSNDNLQVYLYINWEFNINRIYEISTYIKSSFHIKKYIIKDLKKPKMVQGQSLKKERYIKNKIGLIL